MSTPKPELPRDPEVELHSEAGRLQIRRINYLPTTNALREGPVPREQMPAVLHELARLPLVTLDGRTVTWKGKTRAGTGKLRGSIVESFLEE